MALDRQVEVKLSKGAEKISGREDVGLASEEYVDKLVAAPVAVTIPGRYCRKLRLLFR